MCFLLPLSTCLLQPKQVCSCYVRPVSRNCVSKKRPFWPFFGQATPVQPVQMSQFGKRKNGCVSRRHRCIFVQKKAKMAFFWTSHSPRAPNLHFFFAQPIRALAPNLHLLCYTRDRHTGGSSKGRRVLLSPNNPNNFIEVSWLNPGRTTRVQPCFK